MTHWKYWGNGTGRDAFTEPLLRKRMHFKIVPKVGNLKRRLIASLASLVGKDIGHAHLNVSFDVRCALAEQAPIYGKIGNSVETLGLITDVKQSENSLEITGCVASFDGRPVDDFIVYLQGKPISVLLCRKNLPSPEFRMEFPSLPLSSHGGFVLNLCPLPEDFGKIDDSVFFVCPMIGESPGNVLIAMSPPEKSDLPGQEEIDFVGGNFYLVGLHFLAHLVKYAGLKPNDRILDVGCGIGRIASLLSRYCSEKAVYDGFDIWDSGIEWSKKHISSRYPHFKFQKVDLFNLRYNPSGTIRTSDFIFPYEDQRFDLVFLSSVFTHMYPDDVRHYLREIFRVLKPNGRCLFTCYLLNSETGRLMEEGKSSLNFAPFSEDCYTTDRDLPESAIAFDEEWMERCLSEEKFLIHSKRYGCWCKRDFYSSYQDTLVVVKKN